MSTVHTEQYQPQSSQDSARQRLTNRRQDLILYAHLLQASLVVERNNPLRQALSTHPHLVRNAAVTIVVLLSILAGMLAPQIIQSLNGL
jgi:hypothetical protein